MTTRPDDNRNDRLEFGSGLRIFLARRQQPEAEAPVVYPFPSSAPVEPAQPPRPEPNDVLPVATDPHELLEHRAEQEAEALWDVFREALTATTSAGRPDHRTRLLAARTLLGEVGRVRGPVSGRAPKVKDQLADLRRRRTGT